MALAALDVAHLWLPDRLTGTLAFAGLTGSAMGLSPDLTNRLIGGAAGFGALTLIATAYRHGRGRDGMGAGDPKLLGAIGLWLGWQNLPLVVLGGSALGLVVIAVMRLRGETVSADLAVPFGALIATAAFPVWLISQ